MAAYHGANFLIQALPALAYLTVSTTSPVSLVGLALLLIL